ncbi:anaphase-promoting complex subunit 4 [Rhizoctonia solani]|uniref:Anaphase-promoting complex subunit 4 n=1 Tax=Rhizoctonia solani TaxID=456999 RepID=A0A0K6GFH7_9AGAM|nr:anaphase-promoting complex subunit 4 [Rhizoctonia solani]
MGIFMSVISWLFGKRESSSSRETITPEKWEELTSREAIVPVLIVGRFESPRNEFIEKACSQACMDIEPEPNLKSSAVSVRCTAIDKYPFKLVNAPGFDNPGKSNLEGFMDIAQYLQSGELKSGVKGIVYIHHADDSLQSRSLSENLNVVFGVLLGQSALRLLTILVVLPHHSKDKEQSASILDMMKAPDSVFSAAHKAGARIITSTLNTTDIFDTLKECATNNFLQLQIQRDRPSNLQQAIEQALGYCDFKSVEAALSRKEDATTQKYLPNLVATRKGLDATQKALEQTRLELADSRQKAERYYAIYQQIEAQLGTEQKRVQELSRRLQETQSEYSSLRSQLQIQENVEQSEIVLGLKDLNRAIEDIGRAFSAHFADHYASVFEKDITEVTTLDARDPVALQITFGHVEGDASFVKSSSGEGMLVEDFFDYGIRHLLCGFLWQRIFHPFHPGTSDSFDQLLAGIYSNIQRREPQTVAAKWRVNAFKSIDSGETRDETRDAIIANHTREFCEGIKAIAQAFFGPEQDIQLEPSHSSQVDKLLQMAWGWNAKLKGEVIVLGDFIQLHYDPRLPLDLNLMDEFEPRKGVKAEKILGTLGLGLISAQAMGGDQPLATTVVCKAIVATESLYN